MEEKKLHVMVKKIALGISAIVMILAFESCSHKISFATSSVVPAARGTVKIKKDNNHNYVIKLDIFNLAEVKRLQPAKQAYLVWMVTDGETTKNIGQINSSSSLLSKKLKASFESVSATRPTKIFITAEDDVTTQYPGLQILSTNNF
jgi:hypothetical protein